MCRGYDAYRKNVVFCEKMPFFCNSLGGLGYSLKISTTESRIGIDRYECKPVADEVVTNFVLKRLPRAEALPHLSGQPQFRIPFEETAKLIE